MSTSYAKLRKKTAECSFSLCAQMFMCGVNLLVYLSAYYQPVYLISVDIYSFCMSKLPKNPTMFNSLSNYTVNK